jgi:hypothetical protein
MEIRINGKPADIWVEQERNLGELLSGLEAWLRGSEFCLSGLKIDGQGVYTGAMDEAFARPLDSIGVLDVETATQGELNLEALIFTAQSLEAYQTARGEERGMISRDWAQSAAASFLSARMPELYRVLEKTFDGEDFSPAEVLSLTDERIRELADPQGELRTMKTLVDEAARRMEDLPLDIQTGKDRRAAETMALFSSAVEKLIRLVFSFRSRGKPAPSPDSGFMPDQSLLDDLNAALRELVAAYETKDAVLVGDIAEYELAPRLRSLYDAVRVPAAE